jgi:hypothetical protein
MRYLACPAPGCNRVFLDAAIRRDHADAVHSFDDITELIDDALQETFGTDGGSGKPAIQVWLEEIGDEWAVFASSDVKDGALRRVSYSITNGNVSFGVPVEVERQTVFVPLTQSD